MFDFLRPRKSTPDAQSKVPLPAAGGPMGELWIDLPDAAEQATKRGLDAQTLADIQQFTDQGFIVFPGALSPELADRIVADAHRVFQEPEHYVVRDKGQYVNPAKMDEFRLGHRIIDLYAVSAAAREAVFTPRVSNLLQAAFGEPAVGIQSLYFEYGSQQAIHQDTAYVVSRRPLALAAIWVALEDIADDTGELCYYPGGHRIPHHLFGGDRKHWIQNKDGADAHQAYFKYLHDQAAERNLPLQTFKARKGDVLVWHADLPHGGTRIKHMQTRRSYVVHFAPQSVKAHYVDRIGADYHELPMPSGDFFSCRHYKLAELDEQGRAAVLFDGGPARKDQV